MGGGGGGLEAGVVGGPEFGAEGVEGEVVEGGEAVGGGGHGDGGGDGGGMG